MSTNPALGGAVGGAVQGVFGLIGSGIQAAQASQQYKYTKRLQESAHYWGRERDRQRFKDIRKGLERAGLNPVLAAQGAFGGSGGGMPGTGSVGLPQPPRTEGIVSSALQAMRYREEMRLVNAENIRARQQAREAHERANTEMMRRNLLGEQAARERTAAELNTSTTAYQNVQRYHAELQNPEFEALNAFYSSAMGSTARQVEAGTRALGNLPSLLRVRVGRGARGQRTSPRAGKYKRGVR